MIFFRDTDVDTYHLVHNQRVNHLHHIPGRRSEVTGAGEGGRRVGDTSWPWGRVGDRCLYRGMKDYSDI